MSGVRRLLKLWLGFLGFALALWCFSLKLNPFHLTPDGDGYCHCEVTEASQPSNFKDTTCGLKAFKRGPKQKVVSFSLYNASNNPLQTVGFVKGVLRNLNAMIQHYPGWILRLYTHEMQDQRTKSLLCFWHCSKYRDVFDLCLINQLPNGKDLSKMFPMIWRFLPTLDPQVDLVLSRDLDSLISDREVAAVQEWLESGRPMHAMRDHPLHATTILGGMWGANLTTDQTRRDWSVSWDFIFADKDAFVPWSSKGQDQTLLHRHVYVKWAKEDGLMMQHDSYLCEGFRGTVGWPTRRNLTEKLNFVGCTFSQSEPFVRKCPEKCRRIQEWEFC